MSKELEAFRNILEYPIGYEVVNIDCCVEDIVDGQDVDIVKQALTPPTEQEVCDALSEYLKDKVTYNNKFGFICNDRVIICLYPNNVLHFNDSYPAYIHSLIGRFYEGKAKE